MTKKLSVVIHFILFQVFFLPFVTSADCVKYKCVECGEYVEEYARRKIFSNGIISVVLCADCNHIPPCVMCGMPGRKTHTPDTRRFCVRCYQEGIFDESEAKKLFVETREYLRRNFDLHTNHKIYFSLVDQDLLSTYRLKPGTAGFWKPVGAVVRYNSGIEYQSPKVYRIYVLSGFTRKRLSAIIAHELAHDWMSAAAPFFLKTEMVSEGWARYVEWKYLKSIGEDQLALWQVENDQSIDYGGGFRKFQPMFDKCSTSEEYRVFFQDLKNRKYD